MNNDFRYCVLSIGGRTVEGHAVQAGAEIDLLEFSPMHTLAYSCDVGTIILRY
jgi:hypothetical protein